MLTPDLAKGKITLRRPDGSHPEVAKVFAYDPRAGVALVLLKYDGSFCLDKVCVKTELEAIDEDRKFIDHAAVVAMRAFNIINREDLIAMENPGS